MSVSDGFVEHLKDQLADVAPVRVRRMFGGAGLFAGDLMFGLIIDDALYLKTDEAVRGEFAAEGLAPFAYVARGRTVTTSYWRAPERLLDDPGEMRQWASRALAAARRSTAPKTRGAGKRVTARKASS